MDCGIIEIHGEIYNHLLDEIDSMNSFIALMYWFKEQFIITISGFSLSYPSKYIKRYIDSPVLIFTLSKYQTICFYSSGQNL